MSCGTAESLRPGGRECVAHLYMVCSIMFSMSSSVESGFPLRCRMTSPNILLISMRALSRFLHAGGINSSTEHQIHSLCVCVHIPANSLPLEIITIIQSRLPPSRLATLSPATPALCHPAQHPASSDQPRPALAPPHPRASTTSPPERGEGQPAGKKPCKVRESAIKVRVELSNVLIQAGTDFRP